MAPFKEDGMFFILYKNFVEMCHNSSKYYEIPNYPVRYLYVILMYFAEFQCSFTSRTDLLKFATGGDCRFCLKKIPATERHLTKKHYLLAVKFTAGGTGKFYYH